MAFRLFGPGGRVHCGMRKVVLLLLVIRSSAIFGITEAELQSHIDTAIQAGGGEVVLPPGEVLIQKGLTVKDAKNLRIIGYDAERSMLKLAAGVNTSLLTVTGTADDVRIEKLVFEGIPGETGAGSPAQLRVIPAPPKEEVEGAIHIERCIFQKAAGSAIHASGLTRSQIQMCTFMDLGSAAITLDGQCKAVTVADCHMARCMLAVNLQQTEGCTVTGIEARGCGVGIGVGKKVSGSRLLGNFLDQ